MNRYDRTVFCCGQSMNCPGPSGAAGKPVRHRRSSTEAAVFIRRAEPTRSVGHGLLAYSPSNLNKY